jgi:non-ribosomal peptide synthetase component F
VCLAAPGRDPLTFGRLQEHLGATVGRLRSAGIGRRDRVAIVLPNGPDMATAFLAVASGAVSAPVNPAYKARDCEFTFGDDGRRGSPGHSRLPRLPPSHCWLGLGMSGTVGTLVPPWPWNSP